MITLSLMNTATFDVDAQKGFTPLCPNELPVPDGHNIVGELEAQARFAAYRVGSKDAHPPNAFWIANAGLPQFSDLRGFFGPDIDLAWNAHCIVGTEGFELIDGLPKVSMYDFFVYKGIERDMHPYGACFHDLREDISTGVIEYLQDSAVDTVVVGGLALDYCVKTTAIQLVAAGFRVIVNLAACRAVSEETAATALEEMRVAGVLIIASSDELRN